MTASAATVLRELRYVGRLARGTFLRFYAPLISLLVLLHFPYDTDVDQPVRQPKSAVSSTGFYESAYNANKTKRGVDYESVASEAADAFDIKRQVTDFVGRHNLQNKRVLEVGSGRGYLQDIVADYTGLDISPTVAAKYHKPFVVGSATKLPFPENSFDAVWTIWVLEHIPQPEKALTEMRRVVKPGGVMFLYVAWDCQPWYGDGFEVRPYSDFNVVGKLVKASIPLRTWRPFDAAHRLPIRVLRRTHYAIAGGDTKLHYRALEPNYDVYWRPDSDAAVSLDAHEAMLWFQSRGDTCLNCGAGARELIADPKPLIIRVNKRTAL